MRQNKRSITKESMIKIECRVCRFGYLFRPLENARVMAPRDKEIFGESSLKLIIRGRTRHNDQKKVTVGRTKSARSCRFNLRSLAFSILLQGISYRSTVGKTLKQTPLAQVDQNVVVGQKL